MKRMVCLAVVIMMSIVIVHLASSGDNGGNVSQGRQVESLNVEVPGMIHYQGVLAEGSEPMDGSAKIVFRLYTVQSGGSPTWLENHYNVPIVGGLFTVLLGSSNRLTPDHFSGPDRWLGVEVNDDGEMAPRERIASSAYAFLCLHADDADMLDGHVASDFLTGADDWGRYNVTDDLYEGTIILTDKYVNETGPEEMTGSSSSAILKATNSSSGAGLEGRASSIGVIGVATGSTGYGVSGYGSGSNAIGVRGGASASNSYGGYFISDNYRGLYAKGGGGNEAAYLDGDVTIQGTADMNSFKMSAGAVNDYVLTSDGSGVGSWQPAAGGMGGSGTSDYIPKFTGATTLGNSVIYESSGKIGIGTTSPSKMLDVAGGDVEIDAGRRYYLASGDPYSYLSRSVSGSPPQIILGGSGPANAQFHVRDTFGGTTHLFVNLNNGNVGIGTTSPSYKLDVNGDINTSGDIRKSGSAYSHPDYVFEPGYEILPLDELQAFVARKKHLPNMPSAEEVKKEGVKMFEQNRLMLEKLEEAYLYIFDLEQNLQEMSERIAKLEGISAEE